MNCFQFLLTFFSHSLLNFVFLCFVEGLLIGSKNDFVFSDGLVALHVLFVDRQFFIGHLIDLFYILLEFLNNLFPKLLSLID